MTSFLVNWDPSDFGPWHPPGPAITEDQSQEIAARFRFEWSPSFHQRLEVAIKLFVDHAIRALSGDLFHTIMKTLDKYPDELGPFLRRPPPSERSEYFAWSLVRDCLKHAAPMRPDDNRWAWAVDAAQRMRAEISTIANSPKRRGRPSLRHLDHFMSAVMRIGLSCGVPMTLPGHDRSGEANSHRLYDFAKVMLRLACSYGMQVAEGLPSEKNKAEKSFQALDRSTPRALTASLERARGEYEALRLGFMTHDIGFERRLKSTQRGQG